MNGAEMNHIAADKKQNLSVNWAELNHTAVNSRGRTAVGRMRMSQMLKYWWDAWVRLPRDLDRLTKLNNLKLGAIMTFRYAPVCFD